MRQLAVILAIMLGLVGSASGKGFAAAPTMGFSAAAHAPPCVAKMSDSAPLQRTTTYVEVASWGGTRVTTVALFRYGKVVHRGVTNSRSGRLSIPYAVGDATVGWKVPVIVWMAKDGRQSHCFTSFTPTSPTPSAWCTASAQPANDGYAGDYDIYVASNQPYREATATDSSDTWYDETNGAGNANIRMWHQYAGERVRVTVGGAICYANI